MIAQRNLAVRFSDSGEFLSFLFGLEGVVSSVHYRGFAREICIPWFYFWTFVIAKVHSRS